MAVKNETLAVTSEFCTTIFQVRKMVNIFNTRRQPIHHYISVFPASHFEHRNLSLFTQQIRRGTINLQMNPRRQSVGAAWRNVL
jgi:hypothetical protein